MDLLSGPLSLDYRVSGQECANVDPLCWTLQWLNEVVRRVNDPANAPNCEHDSAETRDVLLGERVTARSYRLYIAVGQDPAVKGACDDKSLLVPVSEIR
jgi:hypothetical protein